MNIEEWILPQWITTKGNIQETMQRVLLDHMVINRALIHVQLAIIGLAPTSIMHPQAMSRHPGTGGTHMIIDRTALLGHPLATQGYIIHKLALLGHPLATQGYIPPKLALLGHPLATQGYILHKLALLGHPLATRGKHTLQGAITRHPQTVTNNQAIITWQAVTPIHKQAAYHRLLHLSIKRHKVYQLKLGYHLALTLYQVPLITQWVQTYLLMSLNRDLTPVAHMHQGISISLWIYLPFQVQTWKLTPLNHSS
jgi:hypothetical protein